MIVFTLIEAHALPQKGLYAGAKIGLSRSTQREKIPLGANQQEITEQWVSSKGGYLAAIEGGHRFSLSQRVYIDFNLQGGYNADRIDTNADVWFAKSNWFGGFQKHVGFYLTDGSSIYFLAGLHATKYHYKTHDNPTEEAEEHAAATAGTADTGNHPHTASSDSHPEVASTVSSEESEPLQEIGTHAKHSKIPGRQGAWHVTPVFGIGIEAPFRTHGRFYIELSQQLFAFQKEIKNLGSWYNPKMKQSQFKGTLGFRFFK